MNNSFVGNIFNKKILMLLRKRINREYEYGGLALVTFH